MGHSNFNLVQSLPLNVILQTYKILISVTSKQYSVYLLLLILYIVSNNHVCEYINKCFSFFISKGKIKSKKRHRAPPPPNPSVGDRFRQSAYESADNGRSVHWSQSDSQSISSSYVSTYKRRNGLYKKNTPRRQVCSM